MGYGGESASRRLEVKNKLGWEGRGCWRKRILGREQDVVRCALGIPSLAG